MLLTLPPACTSDLGRYFGINVLEHRRYDAVLKGRLCA